MKKYISFILCIAIALSCIAGLAIFTNAEVANLLSGDSNDFEGGTVGSWKGLFGATVLNSEGKGVDGTKALYAERAHNYNAVYMNVADAIKANGAGTYTFTVQVKAADSESAGIENAQICKDSSYEADAGIGKTYGTEISTVEWKSVSVSFDITAISGGNITYSVEGWFGIETDTVSALYVKVQSNDDKTTKVYLDNASLTFTSTQEQSPSPTVTPTSTPTPTEDPTTSPDALNLPDAPQVKENNLLDAQSATFEESIGLWSEQGYWNAPILTQKEGVLVVSGRSSRISTPMLNIIDAVKKGGAGDYIVTVNIFASQNADGDPIAITMFRENVDNDTYGINEAINGAQADPVAVSSAKWTTLAYSFTVDKVNENGTVNAFGTNNLEALNLAFECKDSATFDAVAHGDLYIDNVSVVLNAAPVEPLKEAPKTLDGNLLDENSAEFTDGMGYWSKSGYYNEPQIMLSKGALKVANRTSRISTPLLDITKSIIESGNGTYTVALNILACDQKADGDPMTLVLFGDKDATTGIAEVLMSSTVSKNISEDDWTTLEMTVEIDEIAKNKFDLYGKKGVNKLYIGILCTDSENYDAVAHGDIYLKNISLVKGNTLSKPETTGDAFLLPTTAALAACSVTVLFIFATKRKRKTNE